MNIKSILYRPKNLSGLFTLVSTFVLFAFSTQIASAAKTIALSGNLAFGNVIVGTSAQADLIISNAGNNTLQINGITLPPGFSGDFNGSLHAGDTTNITITFSPTAVQSYGGFLTVNSDATSGTTTRAISGTGTAGRAISLSGNLAFGNVPVGSSPTATLTIANPGDSTLTVSSISYPSGFSGSFSGAIAAGASTNVTVTFSPVAVQAYGGTVTVNSDKQSGTNTIAASGTGTGAIISLSGNLNFGGVLVGSSAQLILTITNSGNTTLTISSIDFPTGFSGSFSGTIATGATQNVTVTFSPTDAISYNGTVTVNSDAVSGANTVTASGTGIAVTRVISLSGDLSFGNVLVGTSAQQTLTITNSGNTTLTVSDITFPTGFSGDISSGAIAAGGTTNVTVTFSPVSAIAYSGSITVDSDATSGVNSVTASGNGTNAPTRIISLSGDLSFGDVLVGTSAQLTLTITNSGNTDLTISNITFPTGFSGNISSGTLAPDTTTNVTVTFSPVSAIAYSGSITVDSDATSGVNSVTASGNGTNAPTRIISLSGDLDFGNVFLGSSAQLTLTITNSGNTDLTISDITFPTGFSGDISSGTLAPDTTTNVTVTFSPVSAIAYSGTVTVTSDATSGANTVTASGTGVAVTRVISLSGDLSFGDVLVGTSAQLTLTITNSGNSDLTISNITFPTGFSGDISSGTLAPDATTNVTVTFSPVSAIAYSGSITVDSDATSGVNSVTASGNGTNAFTRIISLSGDLSFGDVPVGSSAQLTLTITNSGNSDLTISNITFPTGFSGDISSGTLAPDTTTNVTVTFSPVSVIAYSGSITVDSDATSGVNTVNASGNGIVATRIISLSGDLNFGDVEVGSTPQLTLTISNGGNSTLTMNSIFYPDGFDGNVLHNDPLPGGVSVAPGATTNMTVIFSPNTATQYGGTVTVNSDATSGINTTTASGDAFLFSAGKSRYAGLFYPTNEVEFTNSGYFSLKGNKKTRAFTAKIRIAGKQYPISGTFSHSGAITKNIPRKGLSTLTITLQAGFNGNDMIKGTVTDGTFTAALIADRNTFNKKRNPAPLAGTYTFTIAGSSDVAQAPTANGTGTITVLPSGVARVIGTLGDGAKVVQTTILSKDGQLPFYATLYSAKGSILGWLTFTNDAGVEIDGTVDWFKLPVVDPVNYPDGFSFQTTVTGN